MVNYINTNEKPVPCNTVFATKYNLIYQFFLVFSRTRAALKNN